MKAPEKIFLYPYSTDGIYEVETKPLEGTVEYTRTEAFVEKAANWLRCHPSSHYDDLEEFANAFKKAMKLYD